MKPYIITTLLLIISVQAHSQYYTRDSIMYSALGSQRPSFYSNNGIEVHLKKNKVTTIKDDNGVVYDLQENTLQVPIDSSTLKLDFSNPKHHNCSDKGLLKIVSFERYVYARYCGWSHNVYNWDTAYDVMREVDATKYPTELNVIYKFNIGSKRYRVDFIVKKRKMLLYSYTISDSNGFFQQNFVNQEPTEAIHQIDSAETMYFTMQHKKLKKIEVDWTGMQNKHIYKYMLYRREHFLWLKRPSW